MIQLMNILRLQYIVMIMALLPVFLTLSSQSLTTTIDLPAGSYPTQICVDEKSNKIYVTDNHNSLVFEINGVSKNIQRQFMVPFAPYDCIVNPLSKKLYIYSDNERSPQYLSVIDLNSGIVDSFYTKSGFYGLMSNFVLHPSMDKVYFNVFWDLLVFNGKSNSLHTVKGINIYGPLLMGQIGIDTVMKRIYVPDTGGSITIVDCKTDSVINTIIIDTSSFARVNVAVVNQLRSLLFVSAWNYTYDKIFSTIDNQFIPPLIDEITTDNWQTIIHESLNIACRSHEVDQDAEIVDIERHTSKSISFKQGCNGRMVAINQNSARAFYVYESSTVILDLLEGKFMVLPIGRGIESVSYSLQLGSFNQTTGELYIPDRISGKVRVIKDTLSSGGPIIASSYIINGSQSLVLKGSRFGILQGTSTLTINGIDLGTATYWSPDSILFVNNSHIKPGNLVLNVFGRATSKILTAIAYFNSGPPKKYALLQNYPNPFNPKTTISFDIPLKTYVVLKVFDIMGKDIITLISENLPAGNYKQEWDASNMPSGIYFYRLQTDSFTETKKLILLR